MCITLRFIYFFTRTNSIASLLLARELASERASLLTMAYGFIFCALVTSVLLVGCLMRWTSQRTLRNSLPPGPKGWPVVGSLYSLGPKSIPACRRFTTLAQRYGPIMFLRMGTKPTVVVSNHIIAKEFFSKEHDKNFDSRPRLATGKHFGYNYSSTVFSSGKQFDMMKKIYKSELLSPTNVKKLAPLRREEIHFLLGDILRVHRSSHAAATVVNVSSMVFKANLNLMGRIIFSQRLFGDNDAAFSSSSSSSAATVNAPPKEIENFKSFVKSATKLVGLFNIGDYIPALRWLDLQGVERDLLRLKPHQEGLLLPIIHEYRRRQREGEAPSGELVDLMGTLVSKHSSMSDESIMAVAIDLMVGGSDSMATAVEWALAELLRHPGDLQAAQAELDAMVGRERLMTEDDSMSALPFLDCIVRETLRLHPPTPLAIPHFSKHQCQLGGFQIPKETTAYINIYAIGRDPEVWDNPNQFQPSRFRNSTVRMMGQHYELLPFSTGRRGCPGLHFAIPAVKLVLGSLLQCFHWAPPPGVRGPEIDVEEALGIVCSRLNPLVATLATRVPDHVILSLETERI